MQHLCCLAFQGTIPVSCLTATAKPEVIEDIKQYFLDKLNLTLVDHIASTQRNNLHYAKIRSMTKYCVWYGWIKTPLKRLLSQPSV